MTYRAFTVSIAAVFTLLWCSMALASGPCLIFTDATGVTITLPHRPLRVVAMAPSITEIVFSLNQGHRLCGVTRYSDYPEGAKALPRIGSYIRPELESIVSLKPDLCIAVKDGNPGTIIQRLNAFGIPVYTVNPDGIDSILRSITEIGGVLGAEAQARTITHRMGQQLAAIDKAVAQVSHTPRIFFQIGISPIVSVGKNTFLDEMIHRAGGDNAVTGKTPYPRFSTEQVLALAPEMIIITSMARNDAFEETKKQWTSWPSLPAVQNNAVYIVNSDILDRPTPRVVEGLSMLARLIHPTLFTGAPHE